ncbi:hypothetical protein KI688_005769 [Linnemannia hyalina]|uniref:FAD-binding domain-containing protein n=1 Tax=Linnemannia hyalina TaxID=64524 RepID=A0A9P7Y3R3_9FUNG|nr:hypothetical protein KI688_005769 [Linnemannia hyalina]
MTTTTSAKTHPGTGEPSTRPKVLIVGAGIGGMTLGMLLTKAGIPFDIYERAAAVKPLGSALFLNPTTAKIFKQCNIWDDIMSICKFTGKIQVGNEQREIEYCMDFPNQIEMFGSRGYIVARPMLYDILHRQVPKERFHMSKKVTTITQTDNGVVLHFSDNTTVSGDILVGADGAYSTIRQCIYTDLRTEERLLASDDEPLAYSNVQLVGQTRPLDHADFPNLSIPDSQFIRILGDNKPYAWTFFTTAQNTICYGVTKFLSTTSSRQGDDYKNSEWGPEAAEAMCAEVRDFPIISGGDKITTVGDLIDLTPKDLISKVMLEEKVFETWHYKRVALIGDGGSGANNAMHDAITLANWLNVLSDTPTAAEIEHAFEKYKEERLPWVKQAYDSSLIFKVMIEANFKAYLVKLVSKYMPSWITSKMAMRMSINQPQVSFLPPTEYHGSIQPAPQASYEETLAILQERAAKTNAGEPVTAM